MVKEPRSCVQSMAAALLLKRVFTLKHRDQAISPGYTIAAALYPENENQACRLAGDVKLFLSEPYTPALSR